MDTSALPITIALMTCDRPEYTRRTLETLYEHNDLEQFKLIHVDDASVDKKNLKLAEAYGFETVARNKRRQGHQGVKRQLGMACQTPYILLLENDWESDRPFPWELFDRMRQSDAYFMRLFGVYKERGRRKCGVGHYGRDKADSNWQPFGDDAIIGDIHWCSPPGVTETDLYRWLHKDTKSESATMRKSGQIERPVIRVVDNVFFHIGEERSPGFRH